MICYTPCPLCLKSRKQHSISSALLPRLPPSRKNQLQATCNISPGEGGGLHCPQSPARCYSATEGHSWPICLSTEEAPWSTEWVIMRVHRLCRWHCHCHHHKWWSSVECYYLSSLNQDVLDKRQDSGWTQLAKFKTTILTRDALDNQWPQVHIFTNFGDYFELPFAE